MAQALLAMLFIILRKEIVYAIQLCLKGTADFWLKSVKYI